MKILGIDPGTATTGYGVVVRKNGLSCVEYGCITTPKDKEAKDRLFELAQGLDEVILRHKPDMMAVETLYFARNLTTAMPVSEARGVVLLAASKHNLPVQEFSPPQVKKAVVGYGRADKRQVQAMVQQTLGLRDLPRPDDAADALSVAIACFSVMGD